MLSDHSNMKITGASISRSIGASWGGSVVEFIHWPHHYITGLGHLSKSALLDTGIRRYDDKGRPLQVFCPVHHHQVRDFIKMLFIICYQGITTGNCC